MSKPDYLAAYKLITGDFIIGKIRTNILDLNHICLLDVCAYTMGRHPTEKEKMTIVMNGFLPRIQLNNEANFVRINKRHIMCRIPEIHQDIINTYVKCTTIKEEKEDAGKETDID